MSANRGSWTAVRADLGFEIHDDAGAVVASFAAKCKCRECASEDAYRAELIALAPLMRDALRRIARMAETGEYGIGDIAAHALETLAPLQAVKP